MYYWNGNWSTFWGCSKEKVKSKVVALDLAASSAGAAQTISIPAGMRSYLVKVTAVGGAPGVVLVGPTGRRIVTPGPDKPKTDRKTWLAVAVPGESATYVDIGRPEPGVWRIEQLPGSVPVRSVGVAEPLPARIVTASVAGSGERRLLRYGVEPAGGQRVVFIEVGADVRRTLATVDDARGEIAFAPAEGRPGVRTVMAAVERDGLVIRTEQVARFGVGAVGLPAPRVSLVRHGANVRVHWLPVAGASAYVARFSLTDGRLSVRRLRAGVASTTVADVGATIGATVDLTAVSSAGRFGRTATTRLAAPAPVAAPTGLSTAAILKSAGLTIQCALPADGVCSAQATLRGKLVARGSAGGSYGGSSRCGSA